MSVKLNLLAPSTGASNQGVDYSVVTNTSSNDTEVIYQLSFYNTISNVISAEPSFSVFTLINSGTV